MSASAGTFTLSCADFHRAIRDGRMRVFESDALSAVVADPEVFELDGDPCAAGRWADDGGRV